MLKYKKKSKLIRLNKLKSSRERARNFRHVRCRLRRVRAVVCELFRGGRAADWPAINEVVRVVCQCGGLWRSADPHLHQSVT